MLLICALVRLGYELIYLIWSLGRKIRSYKVGSDTISHHGLVMPLATIKPAKLVLPSTATVCVMSQEYLIALNSEAINVVCKADG